MPENAIERRVEVLTNRWLDFVERPDRPLLRWWGDADELRMASAFLAYQTSDARDIPDLFLRPETSFRSTRTFAAAVLEEIVTGYGEGREALREDDIPARWEPPPPEEEGSAAHLLRSLLSLQSYHADLVEHVVLVLDSPPSRWRTDWLRWFTEVLELGVPPAVRFLVLEHEAAMLLSDLEKGPHSESMVDEPLDLDMPAAYRELAAAGDPENPGVVFRVAFVDLAQAIQGGDLATARESARRALAIAEPREWWGPSVSVHVALAGALGAAGEPEESLSRYGHAVRASEAAVDAGSPEGTGLLVRSRLAYAGALFGGERFEEAARWYRDTAGNEESDEDPLLRIEAWRMAGHAYASAGDPEQAWECGWQGLEASRDLEEDLCRGSTLPYLGAWLLDLCRRGGAQDRAKVVEARLESLLGPDWEPEPPVPSEPPSGSAP